MGANFRDGDRKTKYLFPESPDEWLPEDHLARFVVEIVDSLDITHIEREYGGIERRAKARHEKEVKGGHRADAGIRAGSQGTPIASLE